MANGIIGKNLNDQPGDFPRTGRNSSSYLNITGAAVLIGILSVAASLYISFSSYSRAHKDTEQRYRNFYLKTARMIAADIESHVDLSDSAILKEIQDEWNRIKNRPPDEYLCIVDKNDRLILHTSHPNTIGNEVGKNTLIDQNKKPICNLHDIGVRKTDYVGGYISSSGQEQLAAFAIQHQRNWIIGVHRSHDILYREVAAGLNPLLIGSLVIFGLLIPVAILILYRTFYKTQKRHRATEDALRKNEEDLKITLNSIGDAVIAFDENGRITGMNPIAEQLTGWTFEDAKDLFIQEVFKIKYPESGEQKGNPFLEVISKGAVLQLPDNILLVSRDNNEYRVYNICTPKKNTAGEIIGAVLVFRDITGKFLMEEKLRQSQKMESIGQLAGGIAHDFNNLLSGIVGYSEALAFKLEDRPGLSTYTDGIIKISKRGADLTQKLLAFSRKGKTVSLEINIHHIINEIFSILERSIDKRISLTPRLEAENPNITGDPSLIQSALLNMAINARDAMPNGGILRIDTQNIELTENFCKNSAFEISAGPYLLVSVSDNGTGIEKETLKHIFEPFFTTKEFGEGTGLGLSAVYGTVVEHNGHIDVFSEPGKGTEFNIYFPTSKTQPLKTDSKEKEIYKGTGWILLVDDEQMIRTVGSELLQNLGFEVILAAGGNEGLKLYKEHREKIRLVILDIIMPDMNGIDCFCKIIEFDPGASVLLSSGFSNVPDISGLLDDGLKGFIHKPFTLPELSKILDNILNPS